MQLMYLAAEQLEFIQLDFYFKPVLTTSYIFFTCKAQELMNSSQYLWHSNPFLATPSYLSSSPPTLPQVTLQRVLKLERSLLVRRWGVRGRQELYAGFRLCHLTLQSQRVQRGHGS